MTQLFHYMKPKELQGQARIILDIVMYSCYIQNRKNVASAKECAKNNLEVQSLSG